MADGYVQVPLDQTGKKIDTTELITTVGTVERQRVEIPDEVQVSGNDLSAMLIEQRVQNLLLAQGFGFNDSLDELRDTVSATALTVAFLQLTDAPSSYTGFAGYNVSVNSTEDGVEFTAVTPASGGLTVGTTTITSGTTTHVVYDNAGVVGEAANFTISSGNPNVTAGNAYLYAGVVAVQADTANLCWYVGNSGNLTGSGSNNIAIGDSALTALTLGGSNCAIGASALSLTTSGNNNLGIGTQALQKNVGGSNNVAIGQVALNGCLSGGQNVGLGTQSLNSLTTHNHNTGVGYGTLSNADSDDNVGIGFQAGANITSGNANICIGFQSGFGLSTGSSNTIIGGFTGVSAALGNTVLLGDGDGNLRIQADSNGIYLKTSATYLVRTKQALTDNAAAQVATMTNGPAAGNPTKWFAIDDNGTTRYVPSW